MRFSKEPHSDRRSISLQAPAYCFDAYYNCECLPDHTTISKRLFVNSYQPQSPRVSEHFHSQIVVFGVCYNSSNQDVTLNTDCTDGDSGNSNCSVQANCQASAGREWVAQRSRFIGSTTGTAVTIPCEWNGTDCNVKV